MKIRKEFCPSDRQILTGQEVVIFRWYFRYALTPVLLKFALVYVIRKVRKIQVGLRWIGTQRLLVYANDTNPLGNNIETRNKRTGTPTDASKEGGLELNVEKPEYISVSRDQNADQIRDIKIGNRSSENVSQF
jgi:hypothetical protein